MDFVVLDDAEIFKILDLKECLPTENELPIKNEFNLIHLSDLDEDEFENLLKPPQDNPSANEFGYNNIEHAESHTLPSELTKDSLDHLAPCEETTNFLSDSCNVGSENFPVTDSNNNVLINYNNNSDSNINTTNNNQFGSDPFWSGPLPESQNNYTYSSYVNTEESCTNETNYTYSSYVNTEENSTNENNYTYSSYVNTEESSTNENNYTYSSYVNTEESSTNENNYKYSSYVNSDESCTNENNYTCSSSGNAEESWTNYQFLKFKPEFPCSNSHVQSENHHVSTQSSNFAQGRFQPSSVSVNSPSEYTGAVSTVRNCSNSSPQFQIQTERESYSVKTDPSSCSFLSNSFNSSPLVNSPQLMVLPSSTVSVIGPSSTVSVTGPSSTVSVTGPSSTVSVTGPSVNTTTVSSSTNSPIVAIRRRNTFDNNGQLTPPCSPPLSDDQKVSLLSSFCSENPMENYITNFITTQINPFISPVSIDLEGKVLPQVLLKTDLEDEKSVSLVKDVKIEQTVPLQAPMKQDFKERNLPPVLPEEDCEYLPETPGFSDEDRASSPSHNSHVTPPTSPMETCKHIKRATLTVVDFEHNYCGNGPMLSRAHILMSPKNVDSIPNNSAHVKRQLKKAIYVKTVEKRKVGRPPKSAKVFNSLPLTIVLDEETEPPISMREKPKNYTKRMRDEHYEKMKMIATEKMRMTATEKIRMTATASSLPRKNSSKRRKTTTNDPKDDLERRANHNTMERYRRNNMKNDLENLRMRVPTLAENIKASKVLILNQAEIHVLNLKDRDVLVDRELIDERKRNMELIHKLKVLKQLKS